MKLFIAVQHIDKTIKTYLVAADNDSEVLPQMQLSELRCIGEAVNASMDDMVYKSGIQKGGIIIREEKRCFCSTCMGMIRLPNLDLIR